MAENEETYPEKMIRELELQKKMLDAEIEGWRMELHHIRIVQEAIKKLEDPI